MAANSCASEFRHIYKPPQVCYKLKGFCPESERKFLMKLIGRYWRDHVCRRFTKQGIP